MSIKISFRGISVEVATPLEAAELMMHLDKMQSGQLKRAASLAQPLTPGKVIAATREPEEPANGYDARAAMIGMLRVLVAAGEQGAEARALMAPLQTNKVKGVGGRLAVVNKVLRQAGIEITDAYVRRHGKFGWAWHATLKTPEVIDYLLQPE